MTSGDTSTFTEDSHSSGGMGESERKGNGRERERAAVRWGWVKPGNPSRAVTGGLYTVATGGNWAHVRELRWAGSGLARIERPNRSFEASQAWSVRLAPLG
jgi:hypothetical protein